MAIPTFPNNWLYGDPYACTNRITECTTSCVVADPVILPDSQSFSGTLAVTITDATVGALIYYTTNGSTPTSASTLYTVGFNVSATTTVKAIGLLSGCLPSNVVSETYTLAVATATVYWGYSSATTLDEAGVLALQGSSSEADPFRQYVFDASSTVNDYFYYWWPSTFADPGLTDGFEDDATASPLVMAGVAEGFTGGPVNGWYYTSLTVNGVPGRLWRSFFQLGGGGAFTTNVNS